MLVRKPCQAPVWLMRGWVRSSLSDQPKPYG